MSIRRSQKVLAFAVSMIPLPAMAATWTGPGFTIGDGFDDYYSWLALEIPDDDDDVTIGIDTADVYLESYTGIRTLTLSHGAKLRTGSLTLDVERLTTLRQTGSDVELKVETSGDFITDDLDLLTGDSQDVGPVLRMAGGNARISGDLFVDSDSTIAGRGTLSIGGEGRIRGAIRAEGGTLTFNRPLFNDAGSLNLGSFGTIDITVSDTNSGLVINIPLKDREIQADIFIGDGNSMTVAGGFTSYGGGSIVMQGGFTAASEALLAGGNITWFRPITVRGGRSRVSAPINIGDSLSVEPGALLTLDNNSSIFGNVTVGAGARMILRNSIDLSLGGLDTVNGSGTITLEGKLVVRSNSSIDVATFDWGAGEITVPGVVFNLNSTATNQPNHAFGRQMRIEGGTMNINNLPFWTLSNGGQLSLVHNQQEAKLRGAKLIVDGGTVLADSGESRIEAPLEIRAGQILSKQASVLHLGGQTLIKGGKIEGEGTIAQAAEMTVDGDVHIQARQFSWGNGHKLGLIKLSNLEIESKSTGSAGNPFVGQLEVNSANLNVRMEGGWTLPAGSTLALNKNSDWIPTVSGNPLTLAGNVAANQGPTRINAAVRLDGSPDVNVGENAELHISGALSSTSGSMLTKLGGGSLVINGAQAHAAGSRWTIEEGGVVLNTSSDGNLVLDVKRRATAAFNASQRLATLMVGGEVSMPGSGKVLEADSLKMDAQGKFDLASNAIILHSDALPGLRAALMQGRNGSGGVANGRWNATAGITSSAATAAFGANNKETLSVGYALNSALLDPFESFAGRDVLPSDLLVRLTRNADANLDGVVNNNDITVLAGFYRPGQTGKHWYQADFNYDGEVNNNDITILAGFYAPDAVPLASFDSAILAPVPEPAARMALALAGIALCRRRAFGRARANGR